MYVSVAVYVSLWHLMTVSGSTSLRIFFVFFFIFPFWLTTSIFLCSSFIILLLLYTHTYIHAYSKKWGRKPLLHIHTYIHAYSKKWSRKPLWLFYISCLISLPEGRLIIAIKGKSNMYVADVIFTGCRLGEDDIGPRATSIDFCVLK